MKACSCDVTKQLEASLACSTASSLVHGDNMAHCVTRLITPVHSFVPHLLTDLRNVSDPTTVDLQIKYHGQ
jgi:hypothetical protein